MIAALTTNGPSLRSILFERARKNSRRGQRTDNFHIALVIECGGMRGVAAGGFMQPFFDSALVDSFDTVHGSSAGACAAAFFLAGQPNEGRAIYNEICTRQVVNPFRFLSQPCMVDTDYIIDKIIAKKQRLDADKIISEPGVLNIITTSVSDGMPAIHKNFETKKQLLCALKATLRVPGPFETGIEIEGRHHLDGGLVAPIPLFSAINSGATHVLIFCTQRAQEYTHYKKLIFFEGIVLSLLYGSRLGMRYIAAQRSDRRSTQIRCVVKTNILMRPPNATYCSRFTINKAILAKVERESFEVAQAYLEDSVLASLDAI